MDVDPIESNPQLYRLVFENDRVRVLEYLDTPGASTVAHHHPDSVMVTLTGFERRLRASGESLEVSLPPGVARWLGAQTHSGENIGSTETHVIFVELKEPPAPVAGAGQLGPALP